jgi:hypothetical protein
MTEHYTGLLEDNPDGCHGCGSPTDEGKDWCRQCAPEVYS